MKPSIRSLLPAALFTTAIATVALAQSVFFDFTASTQNWAVHSIGLGGGHLTNPPLGTAPNFDAANGLPPGSLRVGDFASETWIGNSSSVRGDHSNLYSTQLSYDILYRTRDEADYLAVALAGATITLYQAHERPTLDTWSHWTYSLTPGAWRINSGAGAIATEQEIRAVLADLRGLYIHTEWKTGSDDTSVDNILIGCTGITASPSPTICGHSIAALAVSASGPGPFTYRWQVQSALTAQWSDLYDGAVSGYGRIVATVSGTTTPALAWTDLVGSWADFTGIRCQVTSPCETTTSPRAVINICHADFNCDAVLDIFDYLDFVAAFSSYADNADYNRDGVIDLFDYLDFVSDFAATC